MNDADEALSTVVVLSEWSERKHVGRTVTVQNAFCPTGQGGGVDPSCSPGSHTVVGKAEHVRSAAVEKEIAKAVGGKWQEDNEPADVVKGNHGVEVKSLLKGAKQELTVHPDALLRKVDWTLAQPGRAFHTVAVDERAEYEDGAHSDNYSGHRLYYRRGSGRYTLSSMHPVGSAAELKRLLDAPDSALPDKARGELPKDVNKLREAAEKAHESRLRKDRARKERLKTENVYNPEQPRDAYGKFASGEGVRLGKHEDPEVELTPEQEEHLKTHDFLTSDLTYGYTFYHGTSSEALRSIAAEGLKPLAGAGADAWSAKQGISMQKFQIGDRAASVYMANNPYTASYFAELAAEATGSKPVLLRVTVPQESKHLLAYDEQQTGEDSFRFTGRIPPSWIERVPHIVDNAAETVIHMVLLCKE